MNKIAFVFPGQGAQYIGMGEDFYNNFECCRDVFNESSDLLNIDIKKLCFEDNEKINLTRYTQIAMVTVCYAILTKVKSMGIKGDVCAGLSLGEYPALMASGIMSLKDGIMVVKKRGELMEEAVEPGVGMMAAVLGVDNSLLESVCKESNGDVTIANYNCSGQSVITGVKKSVLQVSEKLRQLGAKKVIPLNVSGPFHSPMLIEAGEKLYQILEKVKMNEPVIPYVSNVNASYITNSSNVAKLLAQQVYSPVLWMQSVEAMVNNDVTTIIEIGPGKTLSALVRKINKDITCINIDKVQDLDKLKEVIHA
jgi:[acyl-carrier-protein] S-malonyltransferase